MRTTKWILRMVIAALMVSAWCGSAYANGNTDRKTLAISGITKAMFDAGMDKNRGIKIGIYLVGTTVDQVKKMEQVVAGAISQPLPSSISIRDSKGIYSDKSGFNANDTSYTGIAWLYAAPGWRKEWTGAGEYDVFFVVGDTDFYRAEKVPFTLTETSLSLTEFTLLPPETAD